MNLRPEQTRLVVGVLGVAQTIAFASTYYLPAILADSIAKDLGVSPVLVFTAFSLALIVSALTGPFGGRFIDRHGGRGLLAASNCLFIVGLFLLSVAKDPFGLFLSWFVLGFGMGIGFYEAGFATLAAIYRQSARPMITGITLIAGFASTIGWPLTAFVEANHGWRTACVVWAGIHLFIALPLNLLLPGGLPEENLSPDDKQVSEVSRSPDEPIAAPPPRYLMPLLAFVVAVSLFNSTAMGTNLPRLLEAAGASTAAAVFAGMLIGPAQVAARIFEYGVMQRFHPLVSARFATLTHPVGAVLLMVFGGPAAYAFTVCHGIGNGIMTISKGTLPLALLGPSNYGYRQSLISAPGRILQAFSPVVFGYVIEVFAARAIWFTAGLSLLACLALLIINISSHPDLKDR